MSSFEQPVTFYLIQWLVLLVLELKSSGQVPLLQSYKSQLLINTQTGQVGFSRGKKKENFQCGSEEELMKCRFMKRDGKNFKLLSFHFEKKGEVLASISTYIVEKERF